MIDEDLTLDLVNAAQRGALGYYVLAVAFQLQRDAGSDLNCNLTVEIEMLVDALGRRPH